MKKSCNIDITNVIVDNPRLHPITVVLPGEVRDYRFAMLRPCRRVRTVPKYNEHNLIR